MIDCLTSQEFYTYLAAIPTIQSREMLQNLEASAYPHLKKEASRKMWDGYSRKSRGPSNKNKGDLIDEIERKLRFGNGR